MTDHPVISPKKLIEVALPLDAINVACAREKSIRHGHPSTLHLWWARRPLVAARAVIFSQLVNDPEDLWRCQNPGQEPNAQVKGHWTKSRARLFKIIEDLVLWENTTNEVVLEKAREEIRESWLEVCELNRNHPQAKELFDREKMPGLHDPFAGGGAIPLEAQRLGLEAYASDLNPVAVLINKAMIEIPPKFAGQVPVSFTQRHKGIEGKKSNKKSKSAKGPMLPELSDAASLREHYPGAAGLAEDVRFYGQWMRDEAIKRIGHLYPPIEITPEMVAERPDLEPYRGKKLTAIAWLWARTVKSPNPAFSHVDVPLASTFILSSKPGKEAWVEPVHYNPTHKRGTEADEAESLAIPAESLADASGYKAYRFTVKVGKPPAEAKAGTKLARGANFRCLLSDVAIAPDYIKAEAMAGRMRAKLMAIVAEGDRRRVYLTPTLEQEQTAESANAKDAAAAIHVPLANDPRNLWCLKYGLDHFDALFTPRQLVALTTFSDLVGEARERIRADALAAGLADDNQSLDTGGTGAQAYAEAVSVYLGMNISKVADRGSTLTQWMHQRDSMHHTFSKQALPMVWDFVEPFPLGEHTGGWAQSLAWTIEAIKGTASNVYCNAKQVNVHDIEPMRYTYFSTDPPYYDNIGYADLSDFFYVWLRRALREVYPELLSTISVPKSDELIASPYRHGSKEKAEHFFLAGMTRAMQILARQTHPAAPITIYYAFKQSETEGNGTNSTGWETFLEAVYRAGLALTGTWPMRTERADRSISMGTNALASSIILVCRPREKAAATISRRQFIRELNATLPLALDAMTRGVEDENDRNPTRKRGTPANQLSGSDPSLTHRVTNATVTTSPVAPVDLSQAIIGPGMAVFSQYAAVLEADGTPMTVRTALQLINRFLAEDDFDADTQFCLHWFEQYGWETGKFGEADTLARAKGTSVDGVKQSGVLYSAGGNVRLLKWAEYPSDWDPQADQRLPIWEVLHQLIRVFNTDGETGAAADFAAVQSKAEAARQLAYRLYTLCERKNWAEDARAYNELITSWTGIESAASRAKELVMKQGELF